METRTLLIQQSKVNFNKQRDDENQKWVELKTL